jgi:TolB protein
VRVLRALAPRTGSFAAFAFLLAACQCGREAPARAPVTEQARDAAALPTLPGAIWFVDDGPPRKLVRLANNTRREISIPDADLFPSRFTLPDGRLVAIASRGDGSADSEQLALVAADGAVERIGPSGAMVRDPVVDPGGAWIVFAGTLDGHSDLYRLELATGDLARLTEDREGNFAPALLGDGVVFASSRDGDSEIYRMAGLDPKAQLRLTAFHKDDWSPVAAADGTLVFLTDREGPVRLFVMGVDGTHQRRLTSRGADEGDELEPTWSADGKRLAYVVEHRSERSVRVRELATGEDRILSPAGAYDAEPSFSPDGAWLALAREGERPRGGHGHGHGSANAIWVVRLSDGVAYPVASGRLPRWVRAQP